MGAIQGDAALLTEEGELLARVQGDDIVNYDIDAYVTRLEAVRSIPPSFPSSPPQLLCVQLLERPARPPASLLRSLLAARSRVPLQHLYSAAAIMHADPDGKDRPIDAPARAVAKVPPAPGIVRREQNGSRGRVVSAVTPRAAALAALLPLRAAAPQAATAGGASACSAGGTCT